MHTLIDILKNPCCSAPAFCWTSAQLFKVIVCSVKAKKLVLKMSGGMPSSHTAVVISLLVTVIARFGVKGFEFPMALFFAFIVIYDARGVRYETGEQGKYLNRLSDRLGEGEPAFLGTRIFDEEAGHTIPEIIAGGILGLLAGLLFVHFLV